MSSFSEAKRLGLDADRAPSVLETDGAQYVRTSEFNYWKLSAVTREYKRCGIMEYVRNTR